MNICTGCVNFTTFTSVTFTNTTVVYISSCLLYTQPTLLDSFNSSTSVILINCLFSICEQVGRLPAIVPMAEAFPFDKVLYLFAYSTLAFNVLYFPFFHIV